MGYLFFQLLQTFIHSSFDLNFGFSLKFIKKSLTEKFIFNLFFSPLCLFNSFLSISTLIMFASRAKVSGFPPVMRVSSLLPRFKTKSEF